MRLVVHVLDRGPLTLRVPHGEGEDRVHHVRAASAITAFRDGFVIAQDDSNYAILLQNSELWPVRLFPKESTDTFDAKRGTKALKPDIEAAFTIGRGDDVGEFAIFLGSGSTPARCRGAALGYDRQFATHVFDLRSLYAAAIESIGIDASALNIEGACHIGGAIRLFQRGNAGSDGINATFDVTDAAFLRLLDGGGFTTHEIGNVRRYDLGRLDGAPLGFSGADTLPDGRVIFAASAEDSPNTFDDGECAGSAIGLISGDGALLAMTPVLGAGRPKIEGCCVESADAGSATLLCVTDPDDPDQPSQWLRLRVEW